MEYGHSRYKLDAPPLARLTLMVSLGGTAVVNILRGAALGLLAAVIAAWPALALALSWELCVWLVDASKTLDGRAVVVVEKANLPGKHVDHLSTVAEILADEPNTSAAEIGRKLNLRYDKARAITSQARGLLARAQ